MKLAVYRAVMTGVTVFVATVSLGLIIPRFLFWALEELAKREDGLQ